MLLVQAKDTGAERKTREREKAKTEGGIFALYIAQSCSLAARRHHTLANLSLQLPKLTTLRITANGS